MAKHYGILIDLDKCVGCQACVVACKAEHDLPPRLGETATVEKLPQWMKVYAIGPTGTFPNLHAHYLPVFCNHCLDAPCIKACPMEAIYRRDDGIVLVDKDRCTGCQQCAWACPFGALSLNENEGVVEKCDMCVHLVDAGLEPSCVKHCPTEAMTFGDLNDPNSEMARRLKATQNFAYRIPVPPYIDTKPSVHYVLRRN